MKKKLTRKPNWTLEEKIGLFNHIKNRIDIIENRDPHPDVLKLKARTWEDIHHELKQKRLCFRGVVRLKEGWSRMKNHAKFEMRTFSAMVKDHEIEESFKWYPSQLSIEINRVLFATKLHISRTPKIKKEIDLTGYLLKILDSHIPAQSLDINSCQTEDEDPLRYVKDEDEDFTPENSSNESATILCITENIKSSSDNTIELINHKRRRHNDIEEHQKDDNEESVSFAEIEYTKDDNVQSRSYDALNEEHKIRLQMLNIELEKAELQKNTALNEFKMSDIKLRLAEAEANNYYSKVRMSGQPGSGAGQGGGGGGAIRSAGGSFGKMEAAHEDQYFYNVQKAQLKKMHEELTDEISFHEEQIKRHQEAINRHKKRIGEMPK